MRSSIRATPSFLVLICSSFLAVTLAQSPSHYTITGDLRDEKGQSYSGATVCAIPADGGIVRVRDKICAETDAQGKFVINLTQAGTYQVTAEKMFEGYVPQYIPFYRDPGSRITEVVVGDDTPGPSVSLAFSPKSGIISGKVIDEAADTPIQDFVVWIWHSRDPNTRFHLVVKGPNSRGRFKLFAPAVPFQLRVVAEGYADWIMGGGVLFSAAGPRKGPGTALSPAGSTADYAVYMKRKNPAPIDPAQGSDEKRLPAPVQISPAENTVLDSRPRTTRLEWAPVAGAVSYGVEVEACLTTYLAVRSGLPDDGECVNPSPFLERLRLANTTIEFPFRGSQPGRWRVWAIDKDARLGLKSPWRRFVHLQ